MKVLILALPRTGSSKLLEAIASQAVNNPNDLSLGVFEPQNPRYWKHLEIPQIQKQVDNHFNILSNLKKVYVKCLITGIWDLCQTLNISIWTYLESYFKFFDEVILLSRKNTHELVESFSNSMSTQIWHEPYEYNFKSSSQDQIKLYTFYILKYNTLLHQIPLKYPQYNINYYEDLFSGNKNYLKEFLVNHNITFDNYDIFFEKVDPKNKYRKN